MTNPSVIVVGQNSTLTLTLTNDSSVPMNLVGGAPVAEASIQPGNPTSFYLDLGTLISATEFANIVVTPPTGWTVTFWPDAVPPTFGLNPAANVTLPAGGQVVFPLANILATESPASGQLNIDYYNFPAVPDNFAGLNVFLQNPPTASAIPLVASITGSIYTTQETGVPISNALLLTILNNQATALIPADTPWEQASPPSLNLTFSYAPYPPGTNALNTVELAKLITVTVQNDTAGNWNTPIANLQGSQPSWTLQPTAANHQVLGPNGFVELLISGIQTDFPVVQQPDVTSLYVLSSYFPGYNDINFAAGLSKLPGPVILSLYCDPVNVLPGQTSAAVTLNWSSMNVAQVTFQGAGIDSQSFQSAGATSATLTEGETIVMLATAGESSLKQSVSGVLQPPTISGSLPPATVTHNALALNVGSAPYILAPNAKTIYAFQSYVDNAGTGFAVLSLPDYTVTTYNLSSAIPVRYGSQNGTMGVTLSPDGNTIYALVQTNCGSGDLNAPSLLLLTVADGSITLATDLGPFGGGLPTSHGLIEPCSIAFSPDGSALYITYCAFSVGLVGDPKPYAIQASAGLLTLDPSTYQVKSQSTFPQGGNWAMDPPVIVGADSSGNLLIASWSGLGFAATTPNLTPLGQLIDPALGGLIGPLSIAPNLEGTGIYTVSPFGHSQNLSVITIDAEPNSPVFTYAQVLPLATQNPAPIALSADGSTVYTYVAPGQVRVIDVATLATFAVQGLNSVPTAILPDPFTLGVFHMYVPGTWTVVTVHPWPWTPAPPTPYKPIGFIPSLDTLAKTSNRINAIANGLGDATTWFELLTGWAVSLYPHRGSVDPPAAR